MSRILMETKMRSRGRQLVIVVIILSLYTHLKCRLRCDGFLSVPLWVSTEKCSMSFSSSCTWSLCNYDSVFPWCSWITITYESLNRKYWASLNQRDPLVCEVINLRANKSLISYFFNNLLLFHHVSCDICA